MFKDKVYEDMDEVSRLFEPFQYDLNDDLSKFPDRIEIAADHILTDSLYSGFGIYMEEVIRPEAKKLNLQYMTDGYNIGRLINNNFFKFEVEELKDGESIKLDARTMRLSHKIFLVKNRIAFDERELESMRKDTMIKPLRETFYRSKYMNKPRFNEIAEIYGANKVKSQRGYYGKLDKFCKHMETMIDDKTLDIRDMNLCSKFPQWIILYVQDGNLAALNNLTRIKIMTHENRPIYSIEEKETK